jgi:chromosome segregation ATPase
VRVANNETQNENHSAVSELQSASESGEDEGDHEILEDNDQQEAADDYRATQILQTQTEKSVVNSPAENGIIETVVCINFMCHTKLHVTLGSSVNFIIGHNGSGKSAVLTAITLCLGGKATSTNRGASLKSFIKEKTESSTLIVKLKNQGDGYQQEQYGNSIIVERTFTRSGSSGFKLKSAAGRVISTKRSDLEEICDFFALQIENPLNVLSQDNARAFLNQSTPADKYKFFLKGVQLEQLDHDYQLLEGTLHRTNETLISKKEDVDALQQRAKAARDKLESHEKNETIRGKQFLLQKQMTWVQVVDEENVGSTV